MNNFTRKKLFVLFGLDVGSRVLPHLPNLSIALLFNQVVAIDNKKAVVIGFVLFSTFITDSLLSTIYHYPLFGTWSLFTYSGFLLLALACSYIKKTTLSVFWGLSCVNVLLYWLWTNFGVWLMTNTYSHELKGLTECYLAALPFLFNQFFGIGIALLAYLLLKTKGQNFVRNCKLLNNLLTFRFYDRNL